ncbi:SMP-30/gluconolactonase/LRE family protein [Terricaulis silvestris]|uniref:Gluconolactonase n=1 Tax=Terricaulis silvestris TaxID=2686094 RepID=A0A6I6MQ62_9CAUL|nr:SMP-30/gluconolactonase/LRE family protein [Terricaulis silvestris]QGZ94927.1 Gluconolactonase precursor [Terricaulis silvestris]
MFAPPPAVETSIFASLPKTLRRAEATTTMSRLLGRPIDSFLEGPSFDRDGNLFCVDLAHGRIFRVDASGHFDTVIAYDGSPNGLKIHADGRIFVADRRLGILVIDRDATKMEVIADQLDVERFRGPNDLVFAPNGDLYFTDQGMSDLAQRTGRVLRLKPSGKLEVVLDELPSPNGIALDAEGRELFVALTRANSVIRATLIDGRAVRVQTYIQLSGGGGPDGLAIDRDGGLAVAHPMMGAVWLFDAIGQPQLRINMCRGKLGTNIAFGGPDGRRLFITESESGTIQTADLPAPGLAMFSHAARDDR